MSDSETISMNEGHNADAVEALKRELVSGFRLMGQARLGLGILAHLTARLPGTNTFWTYQLGQSVEEVRVQDLCECDFEVTPLDGKSSPNPSIRAHGIIYEARPDVNCIVHHHGSNCVALAAIGANLVPYDRNAARWYGDIAALDDFDDVHKIDDQGPLMVEAFGQGNALLVKHHGIFVGAKNIREAIVRTIDLEYAMEVQLKAMAAGKLELLEDGGIRDAKIFLNSDKYYNGTWDYLCRVLARSGGDRDMD